MINDYINISESLEKTFLVYRKGSNDPLWLTQYENEVYQTIKSSGKFLTEEEIFKSIKYNFVKTGSKPLLDVMVNKGIIDVDVRIIHNVYFNAIEVYGTD